MKFKLFMMITSCAIGSSLGQNITPASYIDSIPLDPLVRFGKLDNGFTYYIQQNPDPEKSVELRLVVKAGRIHEDEDQLEYAHLLEHLLAGSTENFPDLKKYFKKRGGYSNAHVGSRHTVYLIRLPSQDKSVVNDGIRLLRDWAQGIHVDEDSIIKQRGAIEGEMRVSDPYRKWIAKTMEKEILKNTAYKTYDEKKHLSNIQNFNPEAFFRFYKDWYKPDLQAAIVVGDIDVDSMENEIKLRFSDLKSPDNPKNGSRKLDSLRIHLNGSNQFSTVTDSMHQELNLKIVRLRKNFESNPKDRTDYKNMLLQQIYNLMIKERANHLEQQYDPPFSTFDTRYGINQIPDRQLDATLMDIRFKSGNLNRIKNTFQNGLMAWKQIHLEFNKADLEKAKSSLLKKYSSENMQSKFLIRRYEDHFIYEKAAPNPLIETTLVSEILFEINLMDVKQFILEYGNLDKNTVLIFFKGTKVKKPEDELFKQWIKETDTMKIMPLKKEQPIQSLTNVVNLPTINSKKEAQFMENEIGVSTIELLNGVKLVFKPTNPKADSFSDRVEIQAFRPNIVPLQNRMEYLAAIVAPQVTQYTGAEPYNKFQLEKFKQDKGITLNFRTNKDNQMIYAQSKTDDLPELLNLLYLYLNDPRKDQKGFEAWKREKENQIEGKGIRGSAEFVMEKIESLWYPQIPVLGMEDLQKLNLEQVFQASRKWFSSIENFTFIVTGDYKKEELIPLLVNTLSVFPAKNYNPVTSKPIFNFPLIKMKENLEFKNIDQAYVRIFFPIKAPRDIKTQIQLQIISKILNKHIHSRLRSGSYSPRASGEWLDINNKIFAFRIDFDSALGNENNMLFYAMEEFRKLRKTGVDKDWLKEAIKAEKSDYESRLSSFGYFNFWADYLQLKLEVNEDPVPEVLNFGTLIEHFITLEGINAAVHKYMSEEHLQQFMGYPEAYQP